MTETNKIVAAFFAAGIWNKVGGSPEDCLQTYDEILAKIENREKRKNAKADDVHQR